MNEIRGVTEYKGLSAQQHDNFYEVFDRFIREISPERIIEIGTAGGGTTLAMNDIMTEMGKPNRVRSYEVIEYPWHYRLTEKGIDLRLENIFNHNYDLLLEEKLDDVKSYIQDQGVTLVVCDGGYKIGEFRELSNLLKSGDYIMAHDYSPSMEYFETYVKDKIWNWCEIRDEHIEDACVRNNLESYMKAEFQSIAWVCKVKR